MSETRRAYWESLAKTLPRALVERLLAVDDPARLESEVPTFACTAMSIAMPSPDIVPRTLSLQTRTRSELLETVLTQGIEPYGGQVIRFANRLMGVAFFGDDCAGRAAAAALATVEHAREHMIRIGLAFGEVFLKVLGDSSSRCLVFGGAAARRSIELQSIARVGEIMIDESVALRLGERASLRQCAANSLVLDRMDPVETTEPKELPLSTDIEEAIARLEPFVPPPLAARLQHARGSWRIDGEVRRVAICITEVTGIGFHMFEELMEMSRTFLQTSRKVGGLILGVDPSMAGHRAISVFGLHAPTDNDTARAVLAALAVTDALRALRDEMHLDEVRLKTSVHVGEVHFGAFGSQHRYDMSVVGAAVGVAEEMLTHIPDFEVAVSGAVSRELGGQFDLRAIEGTDLCTVRGAHAGHARYAQRRSRARHLTGRSITLATLMDFANRTLEGQGAMVGIAGPPGVGKTYLLAPLLDRFLDGGRAVIGRCSFSARTVPLAPLTVMFRNFVDTEGEGETVTQKLREILKRYELGATTEDLLEYVTASSGVIRGVSSYEDIAARYEKVFAAVSELVHLRSVAMPMLCVVEDLHFADPVTLRFLSRFAQVARDNRLLLIGTFRPEPGLDRLRSTFEQVLELDNLGLRDAGRLIANACATHGVDPALEILLWQRTRGNPGEIVELLGLLRDRGLLRYEDGVLHASVPDHALQELVSPSKAQFSLQRIDELSAAERRLLRLAATVGSSFEREILVHMAQDEWPQGLEQAVIRLQDHGILVAELAPQTAYRFRDDGMRAAVYSTIPERERRELHARAANAIERVYAGRHEHVAEVLARHRKNAAQFAMAAYWFERAVQLSSNVLMDDETVRLIGDWESCVAALSGSDAPSERTSALMAVAKLVATARYFSAADALEQARNIASRFREILTPGEASLCDLWHGIALLNTGDVGKARARLSRAFELSTDAVTRCDAALRLAKCCGDDRELGRFWLARAAEEVRDSDGFWADKVDLARACAALDDDELDEARILNAKVRERAIRRGRMKIAAIATSNLADCDLQCGDVEEARRGFAEAAVMSRALGSRTDEAIFELNIGEASLYAGDLREARLHLENALQVGREIQHRSVELMALIHLGAAIALDGQLERGEALCLDGVQLAIVAGSRQSELAGRLHLLHMAIVRGDADQVAEREASCVAIAGGAVPLLQRRLCYLQELARKDGASEPGNTRLAMIS